MKKETHYCDRCGAEIKEFPIWDHYYTSKYSISYHTAEERTGVLAEKISAIEDIMMVETGIISAWYRDREKRYEICKKCRKDFERFMKGE